MLRDDILDRLLPDIIYVKQGVYCLTVLRIRVRGSGFKNPDPDPADPKRPDPTDLVMFLMFSEINNLVWHFYTKFKYLMTLKIKDKNIILTKLYFRQF